MKKKFNLIFIAISFIVGLFAKDIWQISLMNETVAAIGIIAIVAIITFMTTIYANHDARIREIESRHFENKAKIYQLYVEQYVDLMNRVKNKKSLDNDKLVKQMQKIKQDIMIWGDSELINAFSALDIFSKKGGDELAPLRQQDKIFRLLRKNLGHDDKKLKELSLVQLFVTDDLSNYNPKNNG